MQTLLVHGTVSHTLAVHQAEYIYHSGIFHSCNVIDEAHSGCCGLPVVALKVEAMRGFELQSECTFYDYAPGYLIASSSVL